MQTKIDQVVSYGVSSATAGVSMKAGAFIDPSMWTIQDIGVVVGIIGVAIRAYIDITRYLEQKRSQ